MKGKYFVPVVSIAFLGWLVYSMERTIKVVCESCIVFEGARSCGKAAAATRDEAMRQAATIACAPIASGMTESIACQRVSPVTSSCSGESEGSEKKY
jgi:hypothetical protein